MGTAFEAPLDIHELVNKLRCTVTLSEGETIELSKCRVEDQSGPNDAHSIHYADDLERANLTLSFSTVDGVIIGRVSAQLAFREPPFKQNPSFAPDHGVTLQCRMAKHTDGVMANYMHKDWWSRPWFGLNMNEVPPRTQSLLWKRGNLYYYLLPVVSNQYRAELNGTGDMLEVQLSANESGHRQCEALAFAFCAGDNAFDLPERAAAAALQELGYPVRLRRQKAYPAVLEHLGWCTWDALYHQVNAKDILAKAAEFHAKQVPIRWVMIDDGWMNTRESMLCALQPDNQKFPDGLGPVVRELKSDYGVKWVGVWHTVFGYWVGVDPEGEIATQLRDTLFKTKQGRLVPNPNGLAGFGFWNKWHGWLKSEGIDFVKVDGQSSLPNLLREAFTAGEGARASHTALEASVGIHFNNTVINCMGMAADNIWNRPASAVSRSSDDFVPSGEIPFSEHALENAFNSFYHGVFYWGDWDMFWTRHSENTRHAVLRAVSGGPVYVSDKLSETDSEVLRPLILRDGRILRAGQPGVPTIDCLFRDPTSEPIPLKVWSTVGDARVVAAFHLNDNQDIVEASVSAEDVGYGQGDYIVFDFFGRNVHRVSGSEFVPFTLSKNQVALFQVLPLRGNFTPVGALDKYLSTAIIANWRITASVARVSLLDGCLFGFVSTQPVKEARIGDTTLKVEQLGDGLYAIDCTDTVGPVEVDLAF